MKSDGNCLHRYLWLFFSTSLRFLGRGGYSLGLDVLNVTLVHLGEKEMGERGKEMIEYSWKVVTFL